MRSNENFNRNIWHVLHKIQTHSTQNRYDSEIQYDIDLLHSKDELHILTTLSDCNVVRIYQRRLKDAFHVIVTLTPIQPKFTNILKNFEILQPFPSTNANLNQSKIYLKEEISHFQSVLKNLKRSEMLCYKDFRVLLTISNTIKILISQIDAEKTTHSVLFEDTKIKREFSHFSRNKKNYQLSLPSTSQPIPIVGKIEVPGLNERLDKLKPQSPEHSGPKFPYKIPAGTCWSSVIIKFLDDERIEIWVKKQKHITDFKKMGMVGKSKIPTPCEQWLFMKVLAKCYGELSIKDTEARDKYKKQKQALSETLKNYFSIDYDPFYPYQSCQEKIGNSYKIKLTLISPPENPDNNIETDLDDADALGIHEFLNEEAPQVFDS